MKQLTIYDFGVEEQENDYSYLYIPTDKVDFDSVNIINHVDKWPEMRLNDKINIEPIENSFETLRKFLKSTTQEFVQERVNELESLGWKLQPKEHDKYGELLFKKNMPACSGIGDDHFIAMYRHPDTNEDFVEKYKPETIYSDDYDENYDAMVSVPFTIRELELIAEIIHDPYWPEFKYNKGDE